MPELQVQVQKDACGHLLAVLHVKDLYVVGFPAVVLGQAGRPRHPLLPATLGFLYFSQDETVHTLPC